MLFLSRQNVPDCVHARDTKSDFLGRKSDWVGSRKSFKIYINPEFFKFS